MTTTTMPVAASATASPQASHACCTAGTALLVDVRTPAEHGELHAVGARLAPLERFDPHALLTSIPAGTTIHLLCRSGARAAKAAALLRAAGCTTCVVVEGGTEAWAAAGLPVTRGPKAMSLERQVRIAAGFLVFTGVVLGFTVHPYLFGLSGFVGAGLMFAGITDTCAMGMIIARMPWNQAATSAATSAAKPTATTAVPPCCAPAGEAKGPSCPG